MKLKNNTSNSNNKSLQWHKVQATKSELFSDEVAKTLGLTSADLRTLYKQKRAH